MNIKLGLGDPPQRCYLYVGQDEQGSGACWHEYSYEKRAQIQVVQRALTGYITGLRVREITTQKHGVKGKFEILLSADKSYCIRSGMDTVFARGIILSLIAIEDNETLKGALTIVVSPSKDNTKIVFGALYRAENGARIRFQWEKDADLAPLVQHLQTVLGTGGEDDEEHQGEDESDEPRTRAQEPRDTSARAGFANEGQIKELRRVGGLAGFVDHELDAECARLYDGRVMSDLTVGEVVEFRKTLMTI